MFNKLPPAPIDPILQLATRFREDQRPDRMDLGIGVYKDVIGETPVMRSVKEAETLVHQRERTKAYISLAGDEGFNGAMLKLLFGDELAADRARAVQTVGGGAALRLLAETLKAATPGITVWISDPTWFNHAPILDAVGFEVKRYRYLDRSTNAVDFEGMSQDLRAVERGDAVLLHACCHNPSGADLDDEQWRHLAGDAAQRGWIPFVDIAYQGFGNGLDADASGLRLLARSVPELLVSASCSKNFGVYRDRVGCAVLIGGSAAEVEVARATLLSAGRVNYSFPPNHGAAVVATILQDPALQTDWVSELEGMRLRMVGNRKALAGALRLHLNDGRFDYVEHQRGMFSLLSLSPGQIQRLQSQHAIFMPPDGRINVAGLQEHSIARLTEALATVLRH